MVVINEHEPNSSISIVALPLQAWKALALRLKY